MKIELPDGPPHCAVTKSGDTVEEKKRESTFTEDSGNSRNREVQTERRNALAFGALLPAETPVLVGLPFWVET